MESDPTLVASAPATTTRVPWTLLDILKASSLPLGLVVLNVLTEATTDTSQERLSDGDFAFVLGFTMVLELGFLGVVAWFSIRKYHASWGDLGLRRPRTMGVLGAIGLAIGLFFAALVVVYSWVGLLIALGVEPEDNLPEGIFDRLIPILLIALLSLVFAPIIEEFFFRGFVYGGLVGRFPMGWALFASGLLFGLVHTGSVDSFYTILPPVTVIGMMFAWSLTFTGSLYPAIGAHFFFNLSQFITGVSTS
jgi:membrane protease YdiL (CAAX protease family)